MKTITKSPLFANIFCSLSPPNAADGGENRCTCGPAQVSAVPIFHRAKQVLAVLLDRQKFQTIPSWCCVVAPPPRGGGYNTVAAGGLFVCQQKSGLGGASERSDDRVSRPAARACAPAAQGGSTRFPCKSTHFKCAILLHMTGSHTHIARGIRPVDGPPARGLPSTAGIPTEPAARMPLAQRLTGLRSTPRR